MRVNSWRAKWEEREKCMFIYQILILVTFGSSAPLSSGCFQTPVARFSALKAFLLLKSPLFDRYFDRDPRAIFFLLACAVTEWARMLAWLNQSLIIVNHWQSDFSTLPFTSPAWRWSHSVLPQLKLPWSCPVSKRMRPDISSDWT